MNHSFPKERRLRKRHEFSAVFKDGIRLFSKNFSFFFRPVVDAPAQGEHMVGENKAGIARLGITVSKKVGNAVARNRIKRLVREVFRRYAHLVEPPALVVVVAKRTSDPKNVQQVLREWQQVTRVYREKSKKSFETHMRSTPHS